MAFLDRLWADWSPGYDGTADAALVKEALADPERLTAALGYYRSMFAGPPDHAEAAAAQAAGGTVCPQPTLYLHGADDGCMGLDTIGPVTEFLSPGSEMVVLDGAGHFLQVERPSAFNDHVLRFLGELSNGRPNQATDRRVHGPGGGGGPVAVCRMLVVVGGSGHQPAGPAHRQRPGQGSRRCPRPGCSIAHHRTGASGRLRPEGDHRGGRRPALVPAQRTVQHRPGPRGGPTPPPVPWSSTSTASRRAPRSTR